MFLYTREIIRQRIWDASHHLAVFPPTSRKRLLVVQEEGLGNSILTTPLIQALATLRPAYSIEVLVNRSKGADLVFKDWELVHKVWDREEMISFGENLHYQTVLECHPRHELPSNIKYQHRMRIGVHPQPGMDYHWLFKKHEAEYLLDLARELGYQGPRPALRKLAGDPKYSFSFSANMVALGIGYYKGLRADGRDWSDRHWGTDRFLELSQALQKKGLRPILVGDAKDFEKDGHFLAEQGIESICGKLSLPQVIDFLSHCCAFIGNDTGLMHVAASVDIPVVGIFVTTNSIKSYPLGKRCIAMGGDMGEQVYGISAEDVLLTFLVKLAL
jgi:ADP-heptose:LPS heptosyltransferase